MDTSDPLQVRDKRANNRYFIDNALLRGGWGAKLGPHALAVYNAIALHADNETQTAYPSYKKIADLTGMSSRQVPREIEKLVKYKIIYVESRADERKTSIITLIDESEWIPPHTTEGHMTESHMPDSQQTNDSESSEHMTGSHTNNTHTNNTQGTKPNHGDSPIPTILLSATPARRVLKAKITASVFEPQERRGPIKFPNKTVAEKFDATAERLNSNLEQAIDTALEQGCNSLIRVVNYIAKWQPNGGNRGKNKQQRSRTGVSGQTLTDQHKADAARFDKT